MNNFKGKIKEYPQVSLDNFESRNLDSCAFFLSHCHADHMVGLEKPAFHLKLKRSCAKLYTSAVTKCLLIADSRYKHLEPFIVTCTVGESKTFLLRGDRSCNGTSVIITPLQAGHCPGSVMFFFEGDAGNVLYTGDFRLSADDWPGMNSLFAGNRVKTIDCVYMDTTFCKPSARYLPTREESRDAIFRLTDEWLSKSRGNVVYVSCAAQYGTEYIFIELSKKYKMKVHVTASKYRCYADVPEIADYVTADGNDTKIHACFAKDLEDETCKKWSPLRCISKNGRMGGDEILVIRPSTMFFDRHVTVNEIVCKSRDSNRFRVSYSMHSSLSEIFAAVEFLNPREVHPIVVPEGCSDHSLRSMLKEVLSGSPDEIPTVDADVRDDAEDGDVPNGSQDTYRTSSRNSRSSVEEDWDSDDVVNHVNDVRSSTHRYGYDFEFSRSCSPSSGRPESNAGDGFYDDASLNFGSVNVPPSRCGDFDVAHASPVKKKMRTDIETDDVESVGFENSDDGDTTPDILF